MNIHALDVKLLLSNGEIQSRLQAQVAQPFPPDNQSYSGYETHLGFLNRFVAC